MAVVRRGGARQALDLHHLAFPFQEIGHQLPHHPPDFHVIGPDESRILVRVNLAVEEDDGNAGVKGLFHGAGDGAGLVGGNHQEVYSFPHELPDLLHLPVTVVIGRYKADLNPADAGGHFQFVVQFGAPDVVAALGYANNQGLLPSATGREKKCR